MTALGYLLVLLVGSLPTGPAPVATEAPAAPAALAAPPATPNEHLLVPPHHFDRAHDWFVGGATAADIGGEHAGSSGDTSNGLSFQLDFAAGYFVRKHLAIGGQAAFGATVGGAATRIRAAVGPSLSVRLHLAETAHLLPSVALLYDVRLASLGARKQTGSYFRVDVAAPFVFEVGAGLGLSVGPYLSQRVGEITSENGAAALHALTYGLRAGLLGWL